MSVFKPLDGKWLFLFIAPPSGGKGTQTQYLSQHFNLPRIDTGAELRRMAQKGNELGHQIKDRIDYGHLVKSDIVVSVLHDKLLELAQELPDTRAYILDGYPRNRDQADKLVSMCENLGAHVAKAFYLKVPQDVILERVVNRRICPVCSAIYNLKSKPPRQTGLCDREGAALVQRADDEPEKVSTRLQSFEAETRPMIDRFRQAGTLVKLDGNRPSLDISHDLIQWMQPYL